MIPIRQYYDYDKDKTLTIYINDDDPDFECIEIIRLGTDEHKIFKESKQWKSIKLQDML